MGGWIHGWICGGRIKSILLLIFLCILTVEGVCVRMMACEDDGV